MAAKGFFYVAAVVCCVLASYRIWADEHKKVISSRPAFEMALEQCYWEYSEHNGNTVFSFAAFVINRGAPSVIHGWAATYTIGSSTEPMNRIYPSGDWVLRLGNESITVTKDDLLAVKTMEKRLETGEAKHGRLFFSVSGDRRDQLHSLQFRIEVTCYDFLNQPITARFVPDPQPLKGIAKYPTEKGEILAKRETAPHLSKAEPAGRRL